MAPPPAVPAVVVAGTASGCGKTSVALGLMAALVRRGMAVQPFKVGPDFIDPGHHRAVTGRDSHNLDAWMCGPRECRAIFARHASGADIAVIEGVMGLFDGRGGDDEAGSTAQLAKLLGAPVLLVADVRSMARSAAALFGGFLHFDPDVRFAGLLCNKVGSPNHRQLLQDALAGLAAPLLGCLPRREDIAAPSRHLGLVTAEDHPTDNATARTLAHWIEESMNLDSLLARLPTIPASPPSEPPDPASQVRIGVARDRAFCFYYQENLRRLRQAGAELVHFSPLADPGLPSGLDGLYLGGGYPELHGPALQANTAMRTSVQEFGLSGRPVYAECGGFMYLMRAIHDVDGERHEMAGLFHTECRMAGRFQALGYREVTCAAPSLLSPAPGLVARGHEFRYSALTGPPANAHRACAATDRKGPVPDCAGWALGNVLGSYVHLHFGSNPELAGNFAQACARAREATHD